MSVLFRVSLRVGLVTALMFASGEIAVRALPYLTDHFASSRFRQYDPDLGVSLIPNTSVVHSRSCFAGKVDVNRWGMRDRDRELEADGFRVALLGDSMAEGVHVHPEEVMNRRMESLLARGGRSEIEVLNFGVAGIGTTQEYLLYEKRAKNFGADLVVLLFLRSNDVLNNSAVLQPRMYGRRPIHAPYYTLDAEGELAAQPVASREIGWLRAQLERNSRLYYYLERASLRLPIMGGESIGWQVFGEPADEAWTDAWKVTEKVLAKLNDAVTRDGAEFMVLVLPEIFDIDPDWRRLVASDLGEVPSWFEPEESMERLRAMAERHDFRLSSLSPHLQNYRDRHDLASPYFSLDCDPHFSALGHEVVAEAIVEELDHYGLIPVKEGTSNFRLGASSPSNYSRDRSPAPAKDV